MVDTFWIQSNTLAPAIYLWKRKSSFQLVQNVLKINPISKILFCQTIAHCLAIAFFERHCIKDKIITVKYYHNKNSNSVILVLNFLPLCQEFLQRELWALLEATNSQDRVVNFRQYFRERGEQRRGDKQNGACQRQTHDTKVVKVYFTTFEIHLTTTSNHPWSLL